jgi:RHS repeat-associated protein
VYDGNVVIQERDANNVPVVSYTRGKDLSGSFQGAGGIGGLLGRTDHAALNAQLSTAQAYYHADGSGNITALINTNQITVATYLYDPFGFILSQSGTLADANVYRFSGKEFHLASGLSYFLYRFYEPSLQRWLNRDPIDEDGGINLYSFVRNSTINRVDALGLLPELAPEFLNPEAVQLALELEAEELGISVEQLVAKKAAEAAAKKAAEEAAKALVKRCTKNIGKLAKQFNKTRKEIETAIHKAKKPLQRFKGKGQKSNVDVTIDPTTGEVYPEIPGGGLGDSIGNILDLF